MKNHECIIGLYNFCYEPSEMVTLDELLEIQFTASKSVYTIDDLLDFRKSTNLTKFKYCPECGKKIDWEKIKKELSE